MISARAKRQHRAALSLAALSPLWFILWAIALLCAVGWRPDLIWGLLADGSGLVDASGNIKLHADGTRRLAGTNDDTCCCCANCSDWSPANYTVSVAGTSGCYPTCTICPLNPVTDYANLTTGNLDGTFSLASLGASSCAWRLANVGGATKEDWGNPKGTAVCSTPSATHNLFTVFTLDLTKELVAGTRRFKLHIAFVLADWGFDGTLNVDTCDATSYTISNTTSCACPHETHSGGSAIITPA